MPKSKTQPQNVCWWCGKPGASNEDVVPRWIANLYPEPAWWIHRHAHPDLDKDRVKKARGPATKSRKFCRPCNNGWMSKLEEENLSLVTRMIKGERMRLSSADQHRLALWTCKTMLAFQSMEPEGFRFIDRALYRELHDRMEPPLGTQIWIAGRPGGDLAWHRGHTIERRDGAGSGYGATLALECFVAHLIWQDDAEQELQLGGPARAAFVQIWPIKRDSRLWPPVAELDSGKDLSWVAKSMASQVKLVPALN